MNKCLGFLCAAPTMLFAAEPAAPVSTASGAVGGQLLQLAIGLLLVIGLIFLLAWVMRRVQRLGPAGGKLIQIVASQALSHRDRLVLVQVGDEQVLLGLTPGRITALHVLKNSVQVADPEPASGEFAQRLMDLLGKDQRNKS
jgi:flagellar protein FliO/FliZ